MTKQRSKNRPLRKLSAIPLSFFSKQRQCRITVIYFTFACVGVALASMTQSQSSETADGWPGRDLQSRVSYPLNRCVRSIYVSQGGDDGNSGASADEAMKTITHAASGAGAGDCVIVMPGTYREQVVLSHGGSADSATGYLTVVSKAPHGAKIVPPDSKTYSTFVLGPGANYVVVQGFDIKGGTKGAEAGGGHALDASYGTHHDKFLDNVVHDSGGSGISVAYGDFYTIAGNVAYSNAATNKFQASGISVYQARAISDLSRGFHIVVSENISFRNQEYDIVGATEHTDGNGIIIDDFHNSQNASKAGNYPYETLVQNNLVFGNGGKGIQVLLSDNVTVRNNTAYSNNKDILNASRWRGELNNQQASNNKWGNNIAVSDPAINPNNTAIGDVACCGYVASGTLWKNNMTFNGTVGAPSVLVDGENSSVLLSEGNKLGIDPRFIKPSIDPAEADFHLQPDSPAIGNGTESEGRPTIDLDGDARSNVALDIGAYGYPLK
jgi:parallel beta-helix repeat protein